MPLTLDLVATTSLKVTSVPQFNDDSLESEDLTAIETRLTKEGQIWAGLTSTQCAEVLFQFAFAAAYKLANAKTNYESGCKPAGEGAPTISFNSMRDWFNQEKISINQLRSALATEIYFRMRVLNIFPKKFRKHNFKEAQKFVSWGGASRIDNSRLQDLANITKDASTIASVSAWKLTDDDYIAIDANKQVAIQRARQNKQGTIESLSTAMEFYGGYIHPAPRESGPGRLSITG